MKSWVALSIKENRYRNVGYSMEKMVKGKRSETNEIDSLKPT